ncbi:MAG: hydrogenase expression/formation protein [Gammaproteobacteria bacterium]|nr:hydrogenase expression/formation protein [Gammaproteobacteria bacterium]
MKDFSIPMGGGGPGSQPPEQDGAELEILQLPQGMETYRMPELPEADSLTGLEGARALLDRLREALDTVAGGVEQPPEIDLAGLGGAELGLIDQLLGEGEVSAIYRGQGEVRMQESVLAGVWRVRYLDAAGDLMRDTIEVGPIPAIVARATFAKACNRIDGTTDDLPTGVINAPPLLAEINDKVPAYRPGRRPHVINLTLLPQTEQDLELLADRLGEGGVSILSRGYGNCRIRSTAVAHVWWVQYFNSQDANILNTLEIGGVPEVACAAPEDIRDSRVRLQEMLEIYR